MLTRTNRETIVAVFHNRGDAQKAVRELKAAGFLDSEIGMIARDERGATTTSTGDSADDGTMAAEGAAVGVATGAGVGALWALGIAAQVLPAIGPVIAGGLLTAVLASAAGGAAAAGLIGALIGLGISEEDAKYYEGEVKSGRTVVTVRAGARAVSATEILDRCNAYDVDSSIPSAGVTSLDASVTRDDLSGATRPLR